MEATWIDLLNSDWHDHLGSGQREDRLDSPQWLADYLDRWFPELPSNTRSAAREALRELRALLQRVTSSVTAGAPIRDEDLTGLNRFLASAPSVSALERSGTALRLRQLAVAHPLSAALARIVADFAQILASDRVDRVKTCENPDCLWVFVDESRNRSRRWCEAATCGNVMKVRRFRSRRHAADAS